MSRIDILCTQANLGSWEPPRPQQPLSSNDMQLPTWLWAGLHHFAPGPSRAASYAMDVFSASEPAAAAASSAVSGGGAALGNMHSTMQV